MKVCVLASGSKGNCTYVETDHHRILIDIGTTCLNIEKKLKERDINPSSIDMVLMTHAHTDHISGLPVFLKKYNPSVYITPKIEKEAHLKLSNPIYIDSDLEIDNMKITVLKTSHDVDDSNGYIIEENGTSVVYITDTGYVNERYHTVLSNRSVYVFESNHDVEKLMNNPNYPHQTKIRILSDRGHLSNEDSAYYLSKFIGKDTKIVILAHLSEQNNSPELALSSLQKELSSHQKKFSNIVIAQQKEATELFEV